MRAAECPVFVPRHTGEKQHEKPRLLVGVDLTTASHESLIRQGGHWASVLGGVLDVVYMVPSPAVVGIRNSRVREAALREWETAQIPMRKQMESIMSEMPTEHQGEARVIAGDPENDLVQLSGKYDFVVVGNREHTGLKGYLLGTVASHVVRSAQCDVITLPRRGLSSATSAVVHYSVSVSTSQRFLYSPSDLGLCRRPRVPEWLFQQSFQRSLYDTHKACRCRTPSRIGSIGGDSVFVSAFWAISTPCSLSKKSTVNRAVPLSP